MRKCNRYCINKIHVKYSEEILLKTYYRRYKQIINKLYGYKISNSIVSESSPLFSLSLKFPFSCMC